MFISYAQNFEDVRLWRALKEVNQGFYIDIGAQDPSADSVSKGFYEQGWRGVHVEPVARYARALRESRPDEDVIEAAVSLHEGGIPFFEIADTGLSTGRQLVAERHRESGFAVKELKVASIRLAALLSAHESRDIHWLKIDVEGMEYDALDSWHPSSVRPWIVVVESAAPLQREPSYVGWEPLLLRLGYRFVCFDGLNRFYVHESRSHLADAFQVGPGLFDDFAIGSGSPYASVLTEDIARIRSGHEVEKASLLASHRTEVDDLRQRVVLAAAKSKFCEDALAELRNSTSWRITAPLRKLKSAGVAAQGWLKTSFRYVVSHGVLWLGSHPAAAAFVLRCLRLMPPVERRLKVLARLALNDQASSERRWAFDPDPSALNEWLELMNAAAVEDQ